MTMILPVGNKQLGSASNSNNLLERSNNRSRSLQPRLPKLTFHIEERKEDYKDDYNEDFNQDEKKRIEDQDICYKRQKISNSSNSFSPSSSSSFSSQELNTSSSDSFVTDTSHSLSSTPATPSSPGHRTNQRRKQIDLGKSTLGYHHYVTTIPITSRDQSLRFTHHPTTPNIKKECSKRSWDGLIKQWRRLLHKWDEGGEAYTLYVVKQSEVIDNTNTNRQEEIITENNYQSNTSNDPEDEDDIIASILREANDPTYNNTVSTTTIPIVPPKPTLVSSLAISTPSVMGSGNSVTNQLKVIDERQKRKRDVDMEERWMIGN